MKQMLLVFSHPDDESFTVGGTVAKYVKKGWEVHLLVATNGEKGASGKFTWAKGDALGALRQEEVKKAADILGIKDVQFLGFPDLGLSTLTPGTLEDPIYTAMRTILPDVIITHDPTGITNNPDHIKVSYSTTYAFQKYAAYLFDLQDTQKLRKGRGGVWKESAYIRAFGETVSPSKEPKLYYVCLPEGSVRFLIKEDQIPKELFGKSIKGTPDKDITTIIDISQTRLIKGKALLSYETQMAAVDPYISFVKNPSVRQECFILRMQGVYEVFMGKTDRIADVL